MTKKKIILFTLISLILFTGLIIYKNAHSKYETLLDNNVFTNQNIIDNNTIEKTSFQEKIKIKVHITGEITSPGLYELDQGSRINDLILLSGGQSENADLNKVNLAYELSDGEKIYIPSIFDEDTAYIYNDAGENVSEKNQDFSNNTKIDINKATAEDLQKISGIGPSLAEKITNYRNSNGKFSSIEELKNISGIGDKKFESIKEYITVK